MQNAELFDDLCHRSAIRVYRGKAFSVNLPAKPASFDFDRIEGMLLGLAIGDALGNTTESLNPARRRAEYGEIRNYLPNRHAGGRAVGLPSDDTQLAFWTLEVLLEDGRVVPERLAEHFASRGRIFGIGGTVRRFLEEWQRGSCWDECGVESAGNGALMRIAPVLIPYLRTGGTGVWFDSALATMITHNDYAAISASVAFVGMLWELLEMTEAPSPDWWRARYVELAKDLEGPTRYRPRGGAFTDFCGPLWEFVDRVLPWAAAERLPVVDACNAWYSGAYLLETVPSVLYVLACHANDPEEAIVRAVNDTRDNDTVAAIVGAAVGALHGRQALPRRWIDGLLGRTTADDDGHVFELIGAARQAFWERAASE